MSPDFVVGACCGFVLGIAVLYALAQLCVPRPRRATVERLAAIAAKVADEIHDGEGTDSGKPVRVVRSDMRALLAALAAFRGDV